MSRTRAGGRNLKPARPLLSHQWPSVLPPGSWPGFMQGRMSPECMHGSRVRTHGMINPEPVTSLASASVNGTSARSTCFLRGCAESDMQIPPSVSDRRFANDLFEGGDSFHHFHPAIH